MRIDVGLSTDLTEAADRARQLEATGVDGIFTFEGNRDVFFPLVHAAATDLDIYSNVAIAFPRSPMHLASQAWDLHAASGGRFALGLGTQIKPHIERRFSAEWGRPVARMVELMAAVRAIWANWSDGTPLEHRGDFYRVDLMTPLFVPPPLDGPPPPIWVGALGPRMTEAMAEHADGIIIHPFNTAAFVREETMPLVRGGLENGRRAREDLSLIVGCIAVPCITDEEYELATASIRRNLAFYASTPAYKVVLDHHGLGELQPRLRDMTKRGDWAGMAELIDDDVVDLLAARGTPAQVARRLLEDYGSIAERVALTIHSASDEALAAMCAEADLMSGPAGPLRG